ncbi:MAG: hypothetical protein Q9160_002944 [Pyrenula sp. 1 TL-2023]
MRASSSTETLKEAPESDYQAYLRASAGEDGGKGLPPKPSSPATISGESLFNHAITRPGASYRESFASQLTGLTSVSLPKAEQLAERIKAIPSARKAARAFPGAAEQIQRWTQRAITILSGLKAEDDIEWAAAGGRGALDEVDEAVNNFESLVVVYVQSIEELQSRADIAEVEPKDLQAVVEQMESTLKDWDRVRKCLKEIHEQVELAMEWEELEGTVLSDVGSEMAALKLLISQMEEKRSKALAADEDSDASGVDINELETIVEENPAAKKNARNNRFSLPPSFAAASPVTPSTSDPQEDSNLLGLFARMQPLRASLDFLPMRISMFQGRASRLFPTACTQVKDNLKDLERGWKQLEKDAELLRKELEEDRWVMVFRNAGRQASKMCESVERSMAKLQESIDAGVHHTSPPSFAKKVESFEAKKMHYGPAIDRVLGIILKGIKDRLTVNAEILRLRADLMARTHDLHEHMEEMQATVEEIHTHRRSHSQLRDSVSSIISTDRTTSGTPGSSPASSVYGTPTTKPHLNGNNRRGSSIARPSSSLSKRYSSLPQPRKSSISSARVSSPSPSLSRSSATPTPSSRSHLTPPASNKPRWNTSANTNDLIVGHHYRTPDSSLARRAGAFRTPRSVSSQSSIPLRSPLSREASSSPAPSNFSAAQRTRIPASPALSESGMGFGPPRRATSSLLDPVPYSKVDRNTGTASQIQNSPSRPSNYPPRPASSFAATRAPSSLTNTRHRPSHPPPAASSGAARKPSSTTPMTANRTVSGSKTAAKESITVAKIEYLSSSSDEDEEAFLGPEDDDESVAAPSSPLQAPRKPSSINPLVADPVSPPQIKAKQISYSEKKPSLSLSTTTSPATNGARKTSGIARPGSAMAANRSVSAASAGATAAALAAAKGVNGAAKNKRSSMLPMPRSGRESAAGDRPAWR